MTARELGLALALALVACKPHPKSAGAPEARTATGSAHDPLGDAESRIADNAARMRALGMQLREPPADRDFRRELDDATEEEPAKNKRKPDAARDEPRPTEQPTTPGRPGPAPTDVSPPPPPPTKPVTPPTAEPEQPKGEPSTATGDEDGRCTQICELADVACGLEQQVCRLAELHVGEPRYEDACWRARDQCEVGRDACDECSSC